MGLLLLSQPFTPDTAPAVAVDPDAPDAVSALFEDLDADMKLSPRRRGDTLRIAFSITGGGWVASMFSELRWTLRTGVPESSIVDDSDLAVLHQATRSGGGIVMTDELAGTVTVPASITRLWNPSNYGYLWDLQGTVSGSPAEVYTLASGRLPILADITRAS